MTYFHTGFSTIIGAESFHGPVRYGKGWYQLAIVVRRNLYCCKVQLNSEKVKNLFVIALINDWVI